MGNQRSSSGFYVPQKEKREVLSLFAIFLERQAEKYLFWESSLIHTAVDLKTTTPQLVTPVSEAHVPRRRAGEGLLIEGDCPRDLGNHEWNEVGLA